MTKTQEQMIDMIRQFIGVCMRLEGNNPGLTEFFFQSQFAEGYRENEQRLDQLIEEDDLSKFVIYMMPLRNDWLMCVNEFKKRQKELV